MLIVLGFLLAAAAAVFGIDLIVQNTSASTAAPEIFGQSIGITSLWMVFGIGALCGAGVIAGLALMLGSVERKMGAARSSHGSGVTGPTAVPTGGRDEAGAQPEAGRSGSTSTGAAVSGLGKARKGPGRSRHAA